MKNEELIKEARKVAKIKKTKYGGIFGAAGSALITDKNNVYVGVSLDLTCGIGFCGEHSAIASMVTEGESRIKKIVAVSSNGIIMPPCGRCREMILQVNDKNINTDIIINKHKVVKLKELLPLIWEKRYYK